MYEIQYPVSRNHSSGMNAIELAEAEAKFERDRQRCLNEWYSRVMRGAALNIPEGYRLLLDGEVVQEGDYIIEKTIPGKEPCLSRCYESRGRKVKQEQSANDPTQLRGKWFIRPITAVTQTASGKDGE